MASVTGFIGTTFFFPALDFAGIPAVHEGWKNAFKWWKSKLSHITDVIQSSTR